MTRARHSKETARRILEGLFQSSKPRDGEKAIEACKRAMPEAVLLDWNMPVMDGYEFLNNLRRMPGGDAPPGHVLHDRKRLTSRTSRAASPAPGGIADRSTKGHRHCQFRSQESPI
jgi:CheY-like chemotaxis protein